MIYNATRIVTTKIVDKCVCYTCYFSETYNVPNTLLVSNDNDSDACLILALFV